MTPEEAMDKLQDITLVREDLTVYMCECGCAVLPYHEPDNLWLDRYEYAYNDHHDCECHDLSRQYSLTPIED